MTVGAAPILTFGPFRLVPAERRLDRDGQPVALGGRALDLLIALAGRAGEVVPQRALIDMVWPDVVVEETSLRFHIKNLRKALGDDQSRPRYIATVPSRGYCFVAPLDRSATPAAPLHSPLTGRDEALGALLADLERHRLVTLTGPGGIGKTALAGEAMRLAGIGTHFVDLAPVEDAARLPAVLAAAVGLPAAEQDPVAVLAAGGRPLLLILDNCEQLIDAAAALAERLLAEAPAARLLVTSREPLRVAGERVHRLPPLALPPDGGDLTAAQALNYAAVQLFAARAADAGFPLDHAAAAAAAAICRRLDGIPLALELAAARVPLLGIKGVAQGLNDLFTLLAGGRRLALPRHQTLRAAIDWGHDLLGPDERSALRRLSVFRASFSLDCARAVLPGDAATRLAGLVAKSFVTAGDGAGGRRFRLLEPIRLYAAEKLARSDEAQDAAHHHAGRQLDRARAGDGDPAEIGAALDWLEAQPHAPADLRRALSVALSGALRAGGAPDALWRQAAAKRVQGDYAGALAAAERFAALGDTISSRRLRALSLHLYGRQDEAETLARQVLGAAPDFAEDDLDPHAVLARILWLGGRADEAEALAAQAPPTCFVLAHAAFPLALWRGDLALAERRLAAFARELDRAPSRYWRIWQRSYDHVLAMERAATPLERYEQAVAAQESAQSDMMLVDLLAALSPDLGGLDKTGPMRLAPPQKRLLT